ncbi:diguanylate cyclase, partial [Psychromonas arctica]
MTINVGEWEIDTALTQISHWQKQGLNIIVSDNIDALQLQQAAFVDRLSTLLAAHPDVPRGSLQLE